MSGARRQIRDLLEAAGFRPERKTRHGTLMRNAFGQTVLCPNQTGRALDVRALRNCRADIARLRREAAAKLAGPKLSGSG